MSNLLRFLFLTLFLVSALAQADLSGLALSKMGEYVLLETVSGQAIGEGILGYRPRTGSDIDALLSRLRAPENAKFARELDTRLGKIREEAGTVEDIDGLTTEGRRVLERLSGDYLGVRTNSGGRIEFTAPRATGFAGARQSFLEGPQTPAALARKFGVAPEQVRFSPKNKWPGVVVGLTRGAQMAPEIVGSVLPHPGGLVDTVVVGSGPAGLTSGMILSDAGQKVLILEASTKVGGLATGGSVGGARFGSGAAYYAAPSKAQFRIFQRLGLNNYTKVNAIHENIDSLLLDGKLHQEFWEDHALKELPASFRLYKHAVQRMDKMGMIANQPIEEAVDLTLDRSTAKEIVNKMPEMVAGWKDAKSKRLYQELLADPRVDPKDPMRDVFKYLDPYGRSALGGTTDQVNAMAFFNFQLSELDPRFTGATGTGELSERFTRFFATERPDLVAMQTNSPVAKIIEHRGWVEVIYTRGGTAYSVRAKNVVYSAPMKYAPKIIDGFVDLAPAHAAALAKVPYTDYMVTNIVTEGQVTKGTYDFWFGNTDNKNLWITDMINGRYQEHGPAGPKDGLGIITLYQPKGEAGIRDFTPAQAFQKAEEGVEQAIELMGPTLKMQWGTEIKPKWIIANVYPASIQIVTPGYFTEIAPVFRRPIGSRIYPAGIINGTPSVEEAMFSGQHAAEAIIKKSR